MFSEYPAGRLPRHSLCRHDFVHVVARRSHRFDYLGEGEERQVGNGLLRSVLPKYGLYHWVTALFIQYNPLNISADLAIHLCETEGVLQPEDISGRRGALLRLRVIHMRGRLY